LASEALAANQSWVLLKIITKEVRLKPRFKDRQRVSADYCLRYVIVGLRGEITEEEDIHDEELRTAAESI